MSRSPLLRVVSTVAGVAAIVVSAAAPAVAASKKGPTTQTPSITSGPAQGSFQPSRTATFAFKDVASNASFQCKLDGGTAGTCKSPKTYTKLADGSHTFTLTATAPGKKPSVAVTRTWTVDLHVPAPPTISSAPASLSNTAKATFSFSGETGAQFLCVVDAGAFASCTSGFTTPTLADGGHVFAVKQVARNGLTSGATSFAWDIDTQGPAAPVINSGPANGATVPPTEVAFSFSDTDVTTTGFQCAVTTGGAAPAFTDCSGGTFSPSTSLSDGTYTFHVTAHDAAGNVSGETTRTFTVATGTTPAPKFTSTPPAITKNTTGAFTFTGGTSCTLDAGSASDCSSGSFTTPVLTDGAHTLNVSNGTTSATYTWTVDTTAPAAPVFVAGPANGSRVNTTTGFVALSSDGASTLTCTLDGTATACPGFLHVSGLADGSHTIVATATDAAGNAAAATLTWTVDTIAPHATVSAPASLTAPAVVTFSEAVRATGTTIAQLVVTGTSQVVPTTQTCRSGSSTVACAGSAFGSLLLTPTRALTPGQRYTATVAAGAVQDLATNSSSAASLAFRALRSLQETSAALTERWQSVSASAALGGSFVREHLASAKATWGFTGTAVTWWTVTGPTQGRAYVYVDGARVKAVDNYAASQHFRVARKVTGLANKAHRIQIVVRGLKGAKAGKGTFVSIDGFTVGSTTTNTPSLTSVWRTAKNTHLSGGAASVTDLARSAVLLTFRGTGITWFTVRGPAQGRAQIWLDGVLKTTVDNYAATTTYGVKRSLSKLADKVHTLRIVVLGKHRQVAKGSLITVDRLLVA